MNTRIKELRKHLGMTQDAFGAQIGIKKAAVSQIESGRNSLTSQTILMICDKFGANREWLVTGSGPMFRQRTKEEQLGDLFREVALDPDDAFRKKIFLGLAKLDPEDWKLVESLVDKMLSEEDKSGRE